MDKNTLEILIDKLSIDTLKSIKTDLLCCGINSTDIDLLVDMITIELSNRN
jgi:hypothetical protein